MCLCFEWAKCYMASHTHTHTRKQWNNQNVFGTFPLGTINVSKEINDVCEGILIIRYNEAIVCISLTIADFEFFDCKHNSRKYLGDPISMCRQNFINSMKTDIAIFSSFLCFASPASSRGQLFGTSQMSLCTLFY